MPRWKRTIFLKIEVTRRTCGFCAECHSNNTKTVKANGISFLQILFRFIYFLNMGKFTFQHIYEFPWELVTHTHLTKYPTEKEKNIVGTQIVDAKKGDISFNICFILRWLQCVCVTLKGPGNQIYLKFVVTCLNVLPSVFRKVCKKFLCFKSVCS